jgi:hypothetical protein
MLQSCCLLLIFLLLSSERRRRRRRRRRKEKKKVETFLTTLRLLSHSLAANGKRKERQKQPALASSSLSLPPPYRSSLVRPAIALLFLRHSPFEACGNSLACGAKRKEREKKALFVLGESVVDFPSASLFFSFHSSSFHVPPRSEPLLRGAGQAAPCRSRDKAGAIL